MKRFLKISLIIIAVTFIALHWAMGPRGEWRYKITVSVETPEGVKAGSAVREVRVIDGIQLTPESHPSISVKGEAVVVDLGERGVLFATLDGDAAYHAVFYTFPSPAPGLTPEGIRYYDGLDETEAVPIHSNYLPKMVAFEDLDEPTSVRLVYDQTYTGKFGDKLPSFDITDNFETVFGEGVKLKNVTIQMADEPVTHKIDKWLPWLPSRKNIPGYIGAPVGERKDPTKTYLTGVDFSKGRWW